MKTFIFATGVFNILFGILVQSGFGVATTLPEASPGMVTHLFGAAAAFFGVILVLSSRDLERRGALVAWEGVLRLVGFIVMTYYALYAGYGIRPLLLGATDGVIGLAYLYFLPRYLGVSLRELLIDKRSSQPGGIFR